MNPNPDAFQIAMNQGHSAAWDQNWEEASSCYRRALAYQADNLQALTSLGLALFELERFEDALQCYQKANQINAEDPLPLDKMARIYERLGRLNEAVQVNMQAAELNLKMRNLEKAIDHWNRAVSLDPGNLTARSRLAMVYDRSGRKAEAMIEYMAVAAIYQQNADMQHALQVVNYVLQQAPDYREARQALVLLQNGQPLPSPARPRGGTGPVRMAEVVRQQPQAPEHSRIDPVAEARQKALVQLAARLFESKEDSTPNGQVSRRGISTLTRGTGGLSPEKAEMARIQLHLSQAIDSQTQGNDAQAAQELERAVELGFSHPAAYFDLGYLYMMMDSSKALVYLSQAVRNPEFSLGSYLLMGAMLEKEDKIHEAAQNYLQALRLADMETVSADQRDELRQLYEPVFEAQSQQQDMTALSRLCDTIRTQVYRDDWRAYLQKARQQLPPQPKGLPPIPLAEMLLESRGSQVVELLSEVRAMTSQGLFRSAMEEAFYALQYAPTYMPLHTEMAELLVKENRLQEAADKYILIAQVYSLRGEVDQAVRILTRVTQMAPMDLSVRSRLIEMLIAQSRIDEALQQYIELAGTYYSLAELEMSRQTYLSALKLAQQSKTNRQWAVQILSAIADIDIQHLDWRGALRDYEQLRTLQPEEPNPRMQLINLNMRMGQMNVALGELDGFLALLANSGKHEKAMSFMRDLVDEHPDQLELQRRLAEVLSRVGKQAEAVRVLDILADRYMDLGDLNGAIETVKRIIAFNPANIQDYQAVLAQLTGKQGQ